MKIRKNLEKSINQRCNVWDVTTTVCEMALTIVILTAVGFVIANHNYLI